MPGIVKGTRDKFAGLETRNKLIIGLLGLFAFCGSGLLGLTAVGCTLRRTATPASQPAAIESQLGPLTGDLAAVTEIIDGDTIEVEMHGASHLVRYIGMDTPERGTTFYDEASQANAALVAGRTVVLVKDVSETDQYGRLLRYVFLEDGTFVNAELVRQGYARPVTFPPDVRYQDYYQELQQEAREAGLGLWSAPAPSSPGGSGSLLITGVNVRDEYVDIQNQGTVEVKLDGWTLVSERGDQACPLAGIIGPGQTLRIYALQADADKGGFNCGHATPIWSNSAPDPAVLYDHTGAEVSRR